MSSTTAMRPREAARGEHRIAAGFPATQEHTGEKLCVGLQGQHADACTAAANARLTDFVDNSD